MRILGHGRGDHRDKELFGGRGGYFLLRYTQNTLHQTTAGHPSPFFLWPSWLRLHHSWVQATGRSG